MQLLMNVWHVSNQVLTYYLESDKYASINTCLAISLAFLARISKHKSREVGEEEESWRSNLAILMKWGIKYIKYAKSDIMMDIDSE